MADENAYFSCIISFLWVIFYFIITSTWLSDICLLVINWIIVIINEFKNVLITNQ